MNGLSEANIFHLRHILANFPTKKSAFVDNHRNCVQILCLVGEDNEILVRFHYYGEHTTGKLKKRLSEDEEPADGQHPALVRERIDSFSSASNWKLIAWFQKSKRTIQDICFDPSGRHLLVVCYDNTLHILPILWIINLELGLKTTTSQELENFYWPFRSDEIVSFIVPFSGPHECSNSKTCPNKTTPRANHKSHSTNHEDSADKYSPEHINECVLSSNIYQSMYMPSNELKGSGADMQSSDENNSEVISIVEKSPDGSEKEIYEFNHHSAENTVGVCPFPLSVVWWCTSRHDEQNNQHRAIIGYSDGSICVVGLAPNCPFIANTSIESKSGGILQMVICRDTIVKSVSLLITATSKEQWKLLLEQNSIGYVFPDEIPKMSESHSQAPAESAKARSADLDWQFVIPVPSDAKPQEDKSDLDKVDLDDVKDSFDMINNDSEAAGSSGINQNDAPGSGIFPAARARLASLRDLGAKKIGALKLKLIENKIKSNERDRSRQNDTQLATMQIPSFVPEILTTSKTGPYFIAQFLRDTHLLSALHSCSDTLSVHSMDISLIPLYLYKIPQNCSNVLLTPNIMYATQQIRIDTEAADENGEIVENIECPNDEHENNEIPSPAKSLGPLVNAIGVIGCNSTVLRIGEDSEFKLSSTLGLFSFPDEKIIDIHRVPFSQTSSNPLIEVTSETNENPAPTGTTNVGERPVIQQPRVTTHNYAGVYSQNNAMQSDEASDEHEFFNLDDKSVLEHNFPTIELDQCLVVTNRSLYVIEFNDAPHIVFLDLVKKGEWKACEDFCKTFNLDFNQCIEYAGDVLLRKNKTTQALLTYNVSKIPAVKTALKLAMFGQNGALLHLCAMALRIVYVLKSVYPKNHTIEHVASNASSVTKRNSPNSKRHKEAANSGILCSDFSYETDEPPGDLQMSNSSQFHLSNLLLLTLTEKAIKDKQMMPLWNFLVVNKRYHTNMSSIVLAQSGLYSSTIVLALNRGAHMDAFCALVGVCNQEFGWYSEINDILYQLSDPIFTECIIYLQSVSMDYFDCIQSKCDKLNQQVLERLRYQLDPFNAVFRPVVSHLSSNFEESDKKLSEFCKHLIETFLVVVMRLYTLPSGNDETTNGLNVINVRHEHNQFAIKIENGLNISAGFAHCAAIIDGSCYLWGSNGVNCALNLASPNTVADSISETSPRCLEFISSMGLEVHAVKCGKAHTLILTNNGLYAMGSNLQYQLGIGKRHLQALQPMLVKEFDGKNISLIEAGQYHNAVYADGELYTFGWGIHGQLGHGDIFTLDRPKKVRFFSGKRIRQIALGHAHTLVLCDNKSNVNETILYVFGCNVYGQMGLGQYQSEPTQQKLFKCLLPTQMDLGGETIKHIHTKFFANYAITKSNKLYTWGASPQVVRLCNQTRKRSRMAQKLEDTKNTITSEIGEKLAELQSHLASSKATKSETAKTEESVSQGNTSAENSKEDNVETGEQSDSDASRPLLSKLAPGNLQDKIKDFLRSEIKNSGDNSGVSEAAAKINSEHYLDDEYTEHFLPQQVDTEAVVGEMVQVSSGLYHNVLLTNTFHLYTWGRNFEKQLGRENSRYGYVSPILLELNENVISIDCGADFTIFMTDNLTVKAFGNNNVGQCGREMSSSDRNGSSGKLVRLRVSKRLVRLPDTSQCLDQPIEVALPRPKIRMNYDAVRYLKSIPKFREEFISSEIFRLPGMTDLSPLSENFDYNSLSSENGNDSVTPLTKQFAAIKLSPSAKPSARPSEDVSSEFIHYCLFILHGIYDAHKILSFATLNEFKVRILMLNYYVKEAFSLCLSAAKDTIAMHQSQDDVDLDNLMLTSYVIKLFEYFTKDANIVPIHRTDLKYLIHGIFMYFIDNSLLLQPLEEYFLNNVDHYLFGLSFVLFFNNNNSKLERQLHQKYSHLFGDCLLDENLEHCCGTTNGSSSINTGDDGDTTAERSSYNELNGCEDLPLDFEVLFKNVSTSFKAIICQRLIKFDKELN